jgi:hypothetical protein
MKKNLSISLFISGCFGITISLILWFGMKNNPDDAKQLAHLILALSLAFISAANYFKT